MKRPIPEPIAQAIFEDLIAMRKESGFPARSKELPFLRWWAENPEEEHVEAILLEHPHLRPLLEESSE